MEGCDCQRINVDYAELGVPLRSDIMFIANGEFLPLWPDYEDYDINGQPIDYSVDYNDYNRDMLVCDDDLNIMFIDYDTDTASAGLINVSGKNEIKLTQSDLFAPGVPITLGSLSGEVNTNPCAMGREGNKSLFYNSNGSSFYIFPAISNNKFGCGGTYYGDRFNLDGHTGQ